MDEKTISVTEKVIGDTLSGSSLKKSMFTRQSALMADGYSVSKSFITVLANLTHLFLHPPQNKKNRHSR
jgi:hypothetical protein